MEPKPILVIAGNYRQYEQWMRDNHLCRRTARYARTQEDILGFDNCHYVKTGEWWLSDLDHKITYDIFKVKNITELPHITNGGTDDK